MKTLLAAPESRALHSRPSNAVFEHRDADILHRLRDSILDGQLRRSLHVIRDNGESLFKSVLTFRADSRESRISPSRICWSTLGPQIDSMKPSAMLTLIRGLLSTSSHTSTGFSPVTERRLSVRPLPSLRSRTMKWSAAVRSFNPVEGNIALHSSSFSSCVEQSKPFASGPIT